jgi:hypothetical protein
VGPTLLLSGRHCQRYRCPGLGPEIFFVSILFLLCLSLFVPPSFPISDDDDDMF